MSAFDLDGPCAQLLEEYGQAVMHLHHEYERDKLGLVFGAGSTQRLGFPNWKELIERIADLPEVDSKDVLARAGASTSKSQLLYERFRERTLAKGGVDAVSLKRHDLRIKAAWRAVVHKALYENIPSDTAEFQKNDPYLWAYLPIIRKTAVTVTYNFDNTIERLLDATRSDEASLKGRGYSVVFNANIQLVARRAVIYHPNGYLPFDPETERSSDEVVFLEDSFADQLIDSTRGHYAALSNHFAQNTCLFVGLSLTDNVLAHLLRQNARSFPGRHHYYVRHLAPDETRNPDYERAVRQANFSTYNLITLFLSDEGIVALGKVLAQDSVNLAQALEDAGHEPVRRYFVTGCVSVGKTTTTTQLQSLLAHGEWTAPMPRAMNSDPTVVDPSQIEKTDLWVAEQVGIKNRTLSGLSSGVHVVDRAPLDAFAFGDKPGWAEKARRIRSEVSKGQSKRPLCKGHVILLLGEPAVLAARSELRAKNFSEEQLDEQQERLSDVYQQVVGAGVTVVDTRERSVSEVVRDVAQVVHLEKYVESDLDGALTKLENFDNATNSSPTAHA